jgi:hypothetical protein
MGAFACSREKNPDAKRLCDCYTDVFRAKGNEAEQKHDSCRVIYKEILLKYEGDKEGFSDFARDYEDCQ